MAAALGHYCLPAVASGRRTASSCPAFAFGIAGSVPSAFVIERAFAVAVTGYLSFPALKQSEIVNLRARLMLTRASAAVGLHPRIVVCCRRAAFWAGFAHLVEAKNGFQHRPHQLLGRSYLR